MDDDVVKQARAIWQRGSLEELRRSALGGIDEWLRTGAPPPASVLRDAGFVSEAGPDVRYLRKGFSHYYGHSIPCAEAVAALVRLSPLVELGAGTGYWTALLTAAGADIVATDPIIGEHTKPGDDFPMHAEIERLDAVSAIHAHPDHNAFASWPSQFEPWVQDAAELLPSGRMLAVIVEPPGGITGPPGLDDFLQREFVKLEEIVIPNFPPHRDVLQLWRRR